MVRIKYSALVKLFALCFFALFIIPSLLKLLNGPVDPDGGGSGSGGGGGDGGGGGKEPYDGAGHAGRANPLNKYGGDSSLAAVFKDGVLGNYEEVNPEKREGPGEGGVGVETEAEARGRAEATVREFGFNMYASDKISLDRRIKDTRPAEYSII